MTDQGSPEHPPACNIRLPAFMLLAADENGSQISLQIKVIHDPGGPFSVLCHRPNRFVNPFHRLVYAVEEAIPAGWTVTEVDQDGVYDPVMNRVLWGPFYDHGSRRLNYTASASPRAPGRTAFSGIVSFDGWSAAVEHDIRLRKQEGIYRFGDSWICATDWPVNSAGTGYPGRY